MPKSMGFGIFMGFHLINSYQFLFAQHNTKYTNICNVISLNVQKISYGKTNHYE